MLIIRVNILFKLLLIAEAFTRYIFHLLICSTIAYNFTTIALPV
ncbi:hypothetical protein MuYL_4386 [Mucilaginibacter xinganensis]|uniref:Uncharacterized protein n=1 Tax=Mucilaginibacter xinganensis TaxID=1234841 RepID=A0A223P376_9SPHI|nr:hypothetical protein MuYL_4386 [Mucilaginibacter xinganensis]